MTSLLEDIQAENAITIDEARSLAGLVLVEMCGSIKTTHTCRPVVAALVGNQTELHFPTWDTTEEKDQVFDSINTGLVERDASATVCAFAGTYTPDSNSTPMKAVIILVNAPGWRQMMIQPFEIKEDDITWQEPFFADDFESPLTEISCAN